MVMFPWNMVTIWTRCQSKDLSLFLSVCFLIFVVFSNFIVNSTRSGEWGDHVTLQAAADSV